MSDHDSQSDLNSAEYLVAQRISLPRNVVREAMEATAEQIGDGTVLGNMTADEMARNALINNARTDGSQEKK